MSFLQEIATSIAKELATIFPRRDPMEPRKIHACGPRYPYNRRRRTAFTDHGAIVFAWPSRGGVIVLESADVVDLEFLGLDPLDPPTECTADAATEDAFCQRLLLLGAKWWDSEARQSIVWAIRDGAQEGDRVDGAFDVEAQPEPTMREKRLVLAGWPSTGRGVWIADFETTWAGVHNAKELMPSDVSTGLLRMARTMDERCALLRDRFKATFYADVKEYRGHGFFNAWEWKETGEVGPLLQPSETEDLWWEAYYNYDQ